MKGPDLCGVSNCEGGTDFIFPSSSSVLPLVLRRGNIIENSPFSHPFFFLPISLRR